MKKPENDY